MKDSFRFIAMEGRIERNHCVSFFHVMSKHPSNRESVDRYLGVKTGGL